MNTTDPKIETPQLVATVDLLGPTAYQSELWTVKKDDIYAAIHAVQNGLDYARECLITHDSNLGRTTLKNRTWAKITEIILAGHLHTIAHAQRRTDSYEVFLGDKIVCSGGRAKVFLFLSSLLP